MIELRGKFFAETDRYHLIASSVTDLDWLGTISTEGRPALVIAEGLLMYLTEEEVKALVLRLKEAFPGCSLVFGAFSSMTAKRVKNQVAWKTLPGRELGLILGGAKFSPDQGMLM